MSLESNLNFEQITCLEKIRLYRNALLRRSDKFIKPNYYLAARTSQKDYESLIFWRQELRDLPNSLQPSDLRYENNIYNVNVSIFPKAPEIKCLNILRGIYPFISDI